MVNDKRYQTLSLVFNEPYKCLVKYTDPVARQEVFSDCIYTFEIMPFGGLAFFYLKFESTHISENFGNPIGWNGCLTDFVNSAFVLTSEMGCSWVFERTK